MPFKLSKNSTTTTESPEALFLDLRSRKIPGLLAHQADVLRVYVEKALNESDVALQLPTGSGKTLVGLLLGEWRRRKFGERVIYLCPTRQLVHQVVEQSRAKYGLKVNAFVGKKVDYDPTAKGEYLSNEAVAVTSYSGLFNINPFFDDPQLIILDDAHSAENYIAGLWSVRVDRYNGAHAAIYTALAALLSGILPPTERQKLTVQSNNPWERAWVEKIPTPILEPLIPEMTSVLDAHVENSDLRYSWGIIRDYLHACHVYVGTREILIRPIVPPTNTHAPFAGAKQRVYMSATLGEGGDLERLTGRKKITRLHVPTGAERQSIWEKQSIGRRLFFFPERSLDAAESEQLTVDMMAEAGRALVITPDDQTAASVRDVVRERLNVRTFDAREIEQSKTPFVSLERAVAVVANRYDGIDFLDEECRLLDIEGVGRATNLQEQFMISRMGAVSLYNNRILTRIQQAFGRCTRSATDYAAVIVSGEELVNYLMKRERREFFHPELQAELQFGIDQSKGLSASDFLDNLRLFLAQGEDWSQADNEIVSQRQRLEQKRLPAAGDLQNAVPHEIDYQYAIWQGDYAAALEACRKILTELKDPELKGYRAWWNYLAGAAAWLKSREGDINLEAAAWSHFDKVSSAINNSRWLAGVAKGVGRGAGESVQDGRVFVLIERLENILDKLGMLNDQRYAQAEKLILNNLRERDNVKFEMAHVELGRLLGFEAGNKETQGAPDPWWIVDDSLCFIFEDHSDAENSSSLSVTKARQVASHPNWVSENLPLSSGAEVLPVLITPVGKADVDAIPHLKNVAVWKIEDFREWAVRALTVVRELRRTYPGSGDLSWREQAAQKYIENRIDPKGIVEMLRAQQAARLLKP